jgi:hypothetical protein
MADYINKNILCQAYVHVEPEEITEELLAHLKEHLTNFVKTRADFFLYQNPEISIELKEGSIKVYASIFGTIGALYAGIANYPGFREGAILIYEDTKRLSEYIASESLYETKARHDQIIHMEARTGVVGSLRKLVADLDSLKAMNGSSYAIQHTKKIESIKDQVNTLIENLHSNDDVALVKNGLINIVNELPETPRPPPEKTNPRDAIISYQRELKILKAALQKT